MFVAYLKKLVKEVYLSLPLKVASSHVMKIFVGKSAERLREELPELRKRYSGMHIWARSYFVSTVGIDSDIIKQYARQQQEDEVGTEQLCL